MKFHSFKSVGMFIRNFLAYHSPNLKIIVPEFYRGSNIEITLRTNLTGPSPITHWIAISIRPSTVANDIPRINPAVPPTSEKRTSIG